MDTESIGNLIQSASDARKRAYAPYSGFMVGAAVLMASGRIYTGCNVENVSYGLTLCAERVAIAKAVSDGERDIKAIAVVVDGAPAFPCGACLQVIEEFSGKEPPMVIAANLQGQQEIASMSDLLPRPFNKFEAEG